MTSKRKATEIDGFRTLIEVDDDGEYLLVVDLDRNQLRQEIQNFNSSGEMNATSFKRPIGVSGKSYHFMPPVLPSHSLLPHSLPSPSNPTSRSSPPTAMHSPPAKKKRRPYDVSSVKLEGEYI
ncbi:hypothetical protein QC760_003160 [Botrytis cinerea]